MDLGLEAAKGARGVAVLIQPDWMPPSFFQKFGFEAVREDGGRTVLLRKSAPDAEVALVRRAPEFVASERTVRVDAVFNARCPWLMQIERLFATCQAR